MSKEFFVALDDLLKVIDVPSPILGTKLEYCIRNIKNATEKTKSLRETVRRTALALDMATESLQEHDPKTMEEILKVFRGEENVQ